MRSTPASPPKGKVLAFEQKSDFFYKRGMAKLDKNDYYTALASYRKALEKDPADVEVRFALASLYSEMERFHDSNKVLAPMLAKGNPEPEYFFAMGCNYAGLNLPKLAKECLELYLDAEPDGEYAYDACDMLDALETFSVGEPTTLSTVSPAEQAEELCEKGRVFLTKNESAKAIASFQKALEVFPGHIVALNYLSYTYFYIGKYDKSIETANEVLKKFPNNIQALCQKALVYHAKDDFSAASDIADRLYALDTTDFDDIARVALVMAQLERDEQSYEYALRLAALAPYERDILYQLGVCAYKTKNYKKAAEAFTKLCALDPTDSIARYYRAVCHGAVRTGKGKNIMFPAMYQVPLDEMVARITSANALIKLTKEELYRMWNTSDELEQLIYWVLTMGDDQLSWPMLLLASSFNDGRSAVFLRDFLLRPEQSDKLKRRVISLLATAGLLPQPYIVCFDGRYVPVTANAVKRRIPQRYRDIFTLCLEKMENRCSVDAVTAAKNLWQEFMYALSAPLPTITKEQAAALAAAIERTAHQYIDEPFDDDELMELYGVTRTRYGNALDKLHVLESVEVEML